MSANPYLTHREREILSCLIVGSTNREITAELSISMSTVKAHLSSIYTKLRVSNRTEAALVGLRIFPMLGSLGELEHLEAKPRVDS